MDVSAGEERLWGEKAYFPPMQDITGCRDKFKQEFVRVTRTAFPKCFFIPGSEVLGLGGPQAWEYLGNLSGDSYACP